MSMSFGMRKIVNILVKRDKMTELEAVRKYNDVRVLVISAVSHNEDPFAILSDEISVGKEYFYCFLT